MNRIRKAWAANYDTTLRRADLELYIQQAKEYLTTTYPGTNGLCWYADKQMGEVGGTSAYHLWDALSHVKGSVAQKWQQELDQGMHFGGRRPARVKMVKALIKELSAIVEKDKCPR